MKFLAICTLALAINLSLALSVARRDMSSTGAYYCLTDMAMCAKAHQNDKVGDECCHPGDGASTLHSIGTDTFQNTCVCAFNPPKGDEFPCIENEIVCLFYGHGFKGCCPNTHSQVVSAHLNLDTGVQVTECACKRK